MELISILAQLNSPSIISSIISDIALHPKKSKALHTHIKHFFPDLPDRKDPRSMFPFIISKHITHDTPSPIIWDILAGFKSLCESTASSIYVKEAHLKEARNAIKKIIGTERFNKEFSHKQDKERKGIISKELRLIQNEHQDDVLKKKLANKLFISIDEVTKFANDCWNAKMKTPIGKRTMSLLAIMVSTGCRNSEIANPTISQFSVCNSITNSNSITCGNTLVQQGVAKGKSEQESNRTVRKKILFFDPTEVVERIKEIQQEYDTSMPSEQYEMWISQKMRTYIIKTDFGKKLVSQGYSSKILRTINGVCAHYLLGNGKDFLTFISENLGHKSLGKSDLYYSNVVLTDKPTGGFEEKKEENTNETKQDDISTIMTKMRSLYKLLPHVPRDDTLHQFHKLIDKLLSSVTN